MEHLNALEHMGREIADEQDRHARQMDLSAARLRLRGTLADWKPQGGRSRAWRVGLFAVGACAAVVVAFLLTGGQQLEYRVAGGKPSSDAGAWMSAPADRAMPVEFSDGSRFVLSAGTRGRVVRTATTGAELLVERGRADIQIVPRRGNDWRLDVGPFFIRVTGTRFSVDWNPGSERLVVDFGGRVGRRHRMRDASRHYFACRTGLARVLSRNEIRRSAPAERALAYSAERRFRRRVPASRRL